MAAEGIIMIAGEWRKSSFSNGASACVEVGWRTSTFSAGQGACVEVAAVAPGIAVRDSKRPGGGMLSFEQRAWRVFVSRV